MPPKPPVPNTNKVPYAPKPPMPQKFPPKPTGIKPGAKAAVVPPMPKVPLKDSMARRLGQ